MLLAAIIWNLGTGISGCRRPVLYTLIGAIIGIGLTNAMMTGTSVVDALQHPESYQYFRFTHYLPHCRSGIRRRFDLSAAPLLSGTKKRACIHLTPAEREKKDGKKAAVLDAYRAGSFLSYRRGVFAWRERWSERHWPGHAES